MYTPMRILSVLLFSFLFSPLTQASGPENFDQSRQYLMKIYNNLDKTFYCGCQMQKVGSSKFIPNWKQCGFEPRKRPELGLKVEWEHIVPVWAFGHKLACWAKGGQQHCNKVNPRFIAMETDLHNLVPVVGEIYSDRAHFGFGEVDQEKRVYGKCDLEISYRKRLMEPALGIRGDIARAYFYFSETYDFPLSRLEEAQFERWNKEDPVDTFECDMHDKKARLQGKPNPYVGAHCTNMALLEY